MFDHVGIKVKNIGKSTTFYRTALAPLGYVQYSSDESGAGFGPPGQGVWWIYANQGAGQSSSPAAAHVGFRASNRTAVDHFYQEALKAGGRDFGPPGLRPDYGATYYAAFVLDPDGNNIEAVCMTADE